MTANKNDQEYAARREAFFNRLADLGVDGVLLDHRDDYFYFCGYTGSESALLLSVKKRKGWLLTDSRYIEEAEATASGMDVTLWRKNFAGFVGSLVKKSRFKRMAYTPSTLTVSFFDGARKESGVKDWRDAGPVISELRAVKSPAEVEVVSKALACAQAAFLASRRRWKIGMTEIEVKNDLEWEMRKRGAEDTAFESIIAVGANASLPHAHAGGRKIQAGKMLLLDFGVRMNRYNSDLTRTLWAGEIPKTWLARYNRVLAAQRAGIEAIRPGIAGKIPHQAAQKAFGKLSDYFTHGLGHGIGLAVHENPRLSAVYDRPLAVGNIVTVEPGVYFPGGGGIRVEDMILVEESGARVLSSLPRDAESVVF